MDTYGSRTCRGLQPDDARVGANARDAAEIGASLGRLLNHKDPHRDEAAGNVDPPQRTPPSDRGQSVHRFRPAVIIVLGLIVEPGLDRLRSRWWRGVADPGREF